MTQTLDQIRRQGLTALRTKLGRAGMVRFLQQFETGTGDYAKERHGWVDGTNLDEFRKAASTRQRSRRRKTKDTPKSLIN